ncbi:hypothetical protein FRC07_001961 [Ceratobasidium sp. 392]|nr:hypothetical protein FRC07_001961 [Ceratobasidium sp. 392]
MHELVAFVQFPEISKEIKSHFVALDSCLNHFLASMSITGMVSCLVVTVQYATDVIQMQWVSEFNNIQKAEIEQLERMYTLIEGTIIELNITSQNQDDIATITTKTLELLRNAMDEKMEILHNQETTPVETYVGTQQIVQTIRAVTNIQLPIKFLVGKQCILDAIVPIKTGVTYDIYSASFLVNEKVAKKVFRGIWRKEQLEQYAQRFLREAKLRATFRSDYILPLYGIGADECKNNRHVQLYIVSPLMKNFDAVTYLRRHKENPNMKEGIMRIVTDAAKGLQYLHNQDPPVVHYGMRGDNILITDSGGGILCGFSLTKALPTGTENEDFPWVALNDQTHSPRWMAPEMFTKDAVVPHTPSDVWGWAMAALELISGLPPYYRSKSLHTIMPQILMSKRSLRSKYADFEKYALRPDKMWELLDRCWAVEPKDRPTIDEVLVDLEKMTRK